MTKKQFEQRCRDIARGAFGGYGGFEQIDDEESGGFPFAMGLDAFGRWLGAVQQEFFGDKRGYLFEPTGLEKFDKRFADVVTFLWDNLPEDDE